eukprot:GEMP01001134.1.p1 GENE.GEMP01001134.1~~GEMP01001134.1.p1  ORF type:complete len:1487 (+),score=357.35 GEMP01001134.1:24-4463(+)
MDAISRGWNPFFDYAPPIAPRIPSRDAFEQRPASRPTSPSATSLGAISHDIELLTPPAPPIVDTPQSSPRPSASAPVAAASHHQQNSTATIGTTRVTHHAIPPLKTLQTRLSIGTAAPLLSDARFTNDVASPVNPASSSGQSSRGLCSSPTVTSLPKPENNTENARPSIRQHPTLLRWGTEEGSHRRRPRQPATVPLTLPRMWMRDAAAAASSSSTPSLRTTSPQLSSTAPTMSPPMSACIEFREWSEIDKVLSPVPELELSGRVEDEASSVPTLLPSTPAESNNSPPEVTIDAEPAPAPASASLSLSLPSAAPTRSAFRFSFSDLENSAEEETENESDLPRVSPIETQFDGEANSPASACSLDKGSASDSGLVTSMGNYGRKDDDVEAMSEEALWKNMNTALEVLSMFFSKKQLLALSEASPDNFESDNSAGESALSTHLNFALNILRITNRSHVNAAAKHFRTMLRNTAGAHDTSTQEGEAETVSEMSMVPSIDCGPASSSVFLPEEERHAENISVTVGSPRVPTHTAHRHPRVGASSSSTSKAVSPSYPRGSTPTRAVAPPKKALIPRGVPSLHREAAIKAHSPVLPKWKGTPKASKARPEQQRRQLLQAQQEPSEHGRSSTPPLVAVYQLCGRPQRSHASDRNTVPRSEQVDGAPPKFRSKVSGAAPPPVTRDRGTTYGFCGSARTFQEAAANWTLIAPNPCTLNDDHDSKTTPATVSRDPSRAKLRVPDDLRREDESGKEIASRASSGKDADSEQQDVTQEKGAMRKPDVPRLSRKNAPRSRKVEGAPLTHSSVNTRAWNDALLFSSQPGSPQRACPSPLRSQRSQSPTKRTEQALNKAALSALDFENSKPKSMPSRLKPVLNKQQLLAGKTQQRNPMTLSHGSIATWEDKISVENNAKPHRETVSSSSHSMRRSSDDAVPMRPRPVKGSKTTREYTTKPYTPHSARAAVTTTPNASSKTYKPSGPQLATSPRSQCSKTTPSRRRQPTVSTVCRTTLSHKNNASSAASSHMRYSSGEYNLCTTTIGDEASPASSFHVQEAPIAVREVLVPPALEQSGSHKRDSVELPSTSHTIRVDEGEELPSTSRTVAVGGLVGCDLGRVGAQGDEEEVNAVSAIIEDDATVEQANARRKVQQHFQKKSTLESSVDLYATGSAIGHGSFARVYVALHKLTSELVALKVYECEKESPMRAGLWHEAHMFIKLQNAGGHANILRLYEVMDTPLSLSLVLEYAQGGNVKQLVDSRDGLSEELSASLLWQLTSSIQFLHSNMIVHRDVKLDNLVLFDCKKVVKLADFGSALEVADGELLTNYDCAIAYASPEIVRQEPYAPFPVDIWAIGVVLFAMLNGKMPFEGDEATIKKSVLNVTLVECAKSTPYWGLECVLKLLTADPKARPKVNEIRSHAFLTRCVNRTTSSSVGSATMWRFEKLGIERTAIRMGLPSDYVQQSLNELNHASTTYHLLERARRRKLENEKKS